MLDALEELLTEVSEEWRAELKQAILELDMEKILSLIEHRAFIYSTKC